MNLPVSIEVNKHQLMCGCKHTHRHHTTKAYIKQQLFTLWQLC